MPISNVQKALLHVVKAKLGWDDDLYWQVLVRGAGVPSSTELDREGFDALMGFADHCGFRPLAKGAPRYGVRHGELCATGTDPRALARGARAGGL